ncbi:MAG: HEPN domain-containing protein [Nitrospirae bacterium]|nr:HEPN domain-containing protein [Nitrospirota bacterium]MBI5695712.1 HEPN domain-containing protein [Nitrospirota bacterium]
MHSLKSIARAYLIEGDVDIKMARLAFINSFYSRSVFFSQQASEKAVKACLVMKEVFSSDHNITALFRALYESRIRDFEQVQAAAVRLERYGAKARFPLYQRPDLPIWVPSHSIKEAEAGECLEGGELVYNRLREYLEEAFRADTL